MTKDELGAFVIRETRRILDAHDLLALTHADQEIIRALNRAVLADGAILDRWYDELPADMKDSAPPLTPPSDEGK